MQVAVLLTPYNLDAIRRATENGELELHEAGNLDNVRSHDAVVVDTEFAQLPPVREALRTFVLERPYIGIALAGRLTRDFARDVVIAANVGVSAVILSDFDSGQSIRSQIRDAYLAALPYRICWKLRPVLDRLPAPTRAAVIGCISGALEVRTIGQLIDFSGAARPTFYRHLRDAGIPEPKTIIRVARFLRLLRSVLIGGKSLEFIASEAGFHSYYQFQRHVRAIAGVNPRTLRHHTHPRELVAPIVAAIAPATNGAAAQATGPGSMQRAG